MFLKLLRYLYDTIVHKYYVFKYCCKLGIIWRGIVHDLSKYSWNEFHNNINYLEYKKSPVTVAREKVGYSVAYLYHRGSNPHHFDFWCDYDLSKGEWDAKIIPLPYALEIVADYLGAGATYVGTKSLYKDELRYWNSIKDKLFLHPRMKKFYNKVFNTLYDFRENNKLLRGYFKDGIRNDYRIIVLKSDNKGKKGQRDG